MADVEVVLVVDISNVDHQCDFDQDCSNVNRCCKDDGEALRVEGEDPRALPRVTLSGHCFLQMNSTQLSIPRRRTPFT